MVRINNIEILPNGIKIIFELGQWCDILPFGSTFIINHSDYIHKSPIMRQMAADYIKDRDVKKLLNKYQGTNFPLSLYCTI